MNRIDYGRLRSLTVRDLISALLRDGFFLDRQSGSHYQYYHPDGRRVTVSYHRSSDTFTPRLLRIIIGSQARWTAQDLRRLRLL